MGEKKKKKHGKLKTFIILALAGVFGLLVVMTGAAGGGSVASMAEEERKNAERQESELENFLHTYSQEQVRIAEEAIDEYMLRKQDNTQGGDKYIEDLAPDFFKEQKELQKKRNKGADKEADNMPLDIRWDTYFAGYILKYAGVDTEQWNAAPSSFATKLFIREKLTTPENYIPRIGDIVFFGKPIKNFFEGVIIKARFCGIVTDVEAVHDHTKIIAMRITVAEGCVDNSIVNRNLNYGTSYVKLYQYDLYDTKGNDHHERAGDYVPIMGYATVAEDVKKLVSTDDTRDRKNLVYDIDLKMTYDEAIQMQEGEKSN